METINYAVLAKLDEDIGSPFYIMDGEKYKDNIRKFRLAFSKRYERIIAGYSFKTNYVPALCQIAKNEGCYAEVVSEMEYLLARKLGFEHIIFNGPIKRPSILTKALKHKDIINLDSEYEVDFVCRYKQLNPTENVNVGIRINVNLTDNKGRSAIQCGLRFGRFGFPIDILGRNIFKLREAGIKIISIHGHTSSSDRAVVNYKVITQRMIEICEEYDLRDLQCFDIGGGFFGAAPIGLDLTGRPQYEDYANCIIDEVEKSEWFMSIRPYIVIEPGSSVVSNVFSYYTKVYQNKRIGNVNFVSVDGTVFDVKPTMHDNNLPHTVFQVKESVENCVCNVVGSTCMEKDVILNEVTLPKLQKGDFIQFRGVGAYTICLTPTFINFLEPILMFEKGEYIEVRRRQNIDDIISIYRL